MCSCRNLPEKCGIPQQFSKIRFKIRWTDCRLLYRLRAAIKAGVSRRPSDDPDNPWGNSGFGLFVLSELGRELGVFRVVSGTAGLHIAGGESHVEATSFKGTAIQLRLRRRAGTSLVDFIESVITRGEATQGGKHPVRASRSTRKIG